MKPQWLKIILIVVLALGILFRFINLDQKPYWQDETYTSLRVSGYGYTEAVEALFTGQIIQGEDVLHFQRLSPDRGVTDTVNRLATENSQHPPLYYAMTRYWAGWFGDSVATLRFLPALISVLALPAMYWLCRELFGSSSIGWVAMLLVAVSPLYLRYAQEARQYSLWMVTILMSSAALLQAMRTRRVWHWSLYMVTLIAGLYCHILFGLLMLAHGLYVTMMERFRLNQTVNCYLLTSMVALFAFTPWIWTMGHHRNTIASTTAWIQQPLPLFTLAKSWGINLCQLFVAWHLRYDTYFVYLAIPVLLLTILAIYGVCRRLPQRTWLFILLLIGVTAIPLVISDFIRAGKLSTNARYFLPTYLGINLAVAYLLAYPFTQGLKNRVLRKAWQITIVCLIGGGLLTCATAVRADTWWGWSEFDVEISRLINQAQNPLVISDGTLGTILPISHLLQPETHLLLPRQLDSLAIPANFNSVFLYHPSESLKTVVEQQGFQPQLIYQFTDDTFLFSLYQVQRAP
jgi:uncharacterized membrane protein